MLEIGQYQGYNTNCMKSYIKKKEGSKLGFRTPDFLKGSKFSGKAPSPKFNPSQFRIQHKGGS